MIKDTVMKTLTEWIHESKDTVFFGGAGVSTESGVPDFRSATGLYAQMGGAERYLSIDYMNSHHADFYEFYRKYFILEGILPNAAHEKLAEMEGKGRLSAVITQNIDGLHQKAGTRKIYELHGNGERFYCQRCKTPYPLAEVAASSGAFYCKGEGCGGFVRPDVVMYGESLDQEVLRGAVDAIAGADLIIVGGSSMTVYPAAGLIHYRRPGSKLVLVNLDATPYDREADLAVNESIGKLFSRLEILPG